MIGNESSQNGPSEYDKLTEGLEETAAKTGQSNADKQGGAENSPDEHSRSAVDPENQLDEVARSAGDGVEEGDGEASPHNPDEAQSPT